jgi:hypothetical protein
MLDKLPDQRYFRVTANTVAFAHVMLPLLYQPFECGSFCDLVKGYIGMDLGLAKTEKKRNLINLFSKTLKNNPTFWKINKLLEISIWFSISSY